MYSYRIDKCHSLQNSGCLGSATEPKLDLTIHDSLQQQKPLAEIHSRISKASISESFWTNSNCDMDVSAVQSQGSVSSVSSSLTNSHGAGSSNASYEFVNHGKFIFVPCKIILSYVVFSFTCTTVTKLLQMVLVNF